MGWKAAGPPSAFRVEGEIIRKPQQLAEIQNKFYKDKISELTRKLPIDLADPLEVLRAAMR